LSDTASRLVH